MPVIIQAPKRRMAIAVRVVAVLVGLVVVLGGCGGSSGGGASSGGEHASIGGLYIATSPDGATVATLDLVRRGSQLTGRAEVLAAVSSDEAQFKPDVLNAQEQPVQGNPTNSPVVDPNTGQETAPSDNAACGGTPMCFLDITGPVTGQLGADNRISITIGGTDLSPNSNTTTGNVNSSGFVLEGQQYKPTDAAHIVTARETAVSRLHFVAIPAYEVHQEINALQNTTLRVQNESWDQALADDVSSLQAQVDEAKDINSLHCDYAELVQNAINGLQSDINDLAKEVKKAQKLVDSLSPAAARAAGGDVATVRSEIAADTSLLDQTAKQAQSLVDRANGYAPHVQDILAQTECGLMHIAFHLVLELGD